MSHSTATELEERGRFPVEDHPVRFHHLSVMDETWDSDQARTEDLPPAEFLHRQYSKMLADSGDRFAAALTVLADTDGVPAVFHCAAGKDRTGLLAARGHGAHARRHRTCARDDARLGAVHRCRRRRDRASRAPARDRRVISSSRSRRGR